MMTGNLTSIARPYARAAFEFALEKNALKEWELFLQEAALISQDSHLEKIMSNPDVSQKKITNLFIDVLGKNANEEMKNFIHLLEEHKRLPVFTVIADQFKQLREEHEKHITVEIQSAIELDAKLKEKFIQALSKRFKRSVSLKTVVNPKLLGGALIRAGDEVIDCSVRGKLNRMLEFI